MIENETADNNIEHKFIDSTFRIGKRSVECGMWSVFPTVLFLEELIPPDSVDDYSPTELVLQEELIPL